jgi:hypothetical protein
MKMKSRLVCEIWSFKNKLLKDDDCDKTNFFNFQIYDYGSLPQDDIIPTTLLLAFHQDGTEITELSNTCWVV